MNFFTEEDCEENGCLSLKKANRLLRERGRMVYSFGSRDEAMAPDSGWDTNPDDATYQALLINIESIDTLEKHLLRKIVKLLEDRGLVSDEKFSELVEECKFILEEF